MKVLIIGAGVAGLTLAALLRGRGESAKFHDCRCRHWRRGRVVLLGDAAVGFLPTAGVGASMAMESILDPTALSGGGKIVVRLHDGRELEATEVKAWAISNATR